MEPGRASAAAHGGRLLHARAEQQLRAQQQVSNLGSDVEALLHKSGAGIGRAVSLEGRLEALQRGMRAGDVNVTEVATASPPPRPSPQPAASPPRTAAAVEGATAATCLPPRPAPPAPAAAGAAAVVLPEPPADGIDPLWLVPYATSSSLTVAAPAEESILDETLRGKERQYAHRIATLEAAAAQAGEAYVEAMSRRNRMRALLLAAGTRHRALVAELHALVGYTGRTVVSVALHGEGAPQTFEAARLRDLLSIEMAEVWDSLLSAKKGILDATAVLEAAAAARAAAVAAITERRAALAAFREHGGRAGIMARVLARLANCALAGSWSAWRAFVVARRGQRCALGSCVDRAGRRRHARAWAAWRCAAATANAADVDALAAERAARVGGVGERLLGYAQEQRSALAGDALTLLSWLRRVDADIHAGEASLHERLAVRGGGGGAATPVLGPAYDVTQPCASTLEAPAVRPPRLRMESNAATAGATWGGGGEDARDGGDARLLQLVIHDAARIEQPDRRATDGDGLARHDTDRALAAVAEGARRAEASAATVSRQREVAALVASLGAAAAVAHPRVRPLVDAYLEQQLGAAETLLRIGDASGCFAAAKRCEAVYGQRRDAGGLLAVYRLLSRLLEGPPVGRLDVALLHWDRVSRLAREVGDALARAEAHEGLGRCLAGRGAHSEALAHLAAAEREYGARNDGRALARVYRQQAASLALVEGGAADALAKRAAADAAETALASTFAAARASLDALQQGVHGLSLAGSATIALEACGPALPLLRQQAAFLARESRVVQAMLGETQRILARDAEEGAAAAAQLAWVGFDDGARSDALRNELALADGAAAAAANDVRALEQRLQNLRAEAADVDEHAAAEGGALALRTAASHPLRAVALNAANARANDVFGLEVGGTPALAAVADGGAVLVYSTLNGTAATSFAGDLATVPHGEPVGHTAAVTTVAAWGDRVYTGSVDCTVRGWDAATPRGWGRRGPIEADVECDERAAAAAAAARAARLLQLASQGGDAARGTVVPPPPARDVEDMRRRRAGAVIVMRGHTAPVTALAAHERAVISGGADAVIFVWDPRTGAALRRVRGHSSSVTALSLDDVTFASGSADATVRMWHAEPGGAAGCFARCVTCRWVGTAHGAAVTAAACVGREVVTGDAAGVLIAWDDSCGAALRRYDVHAGRSVTALQFDATRIVSAGADAVLAVTDFLSGARLQTFDRPHGDARIAALQFDSRRLVTVGLDRVVRVWAWRRAAAATAVAGEPDSAAEWPRGRRVLVQAGETLAHVARRAGAAPHEVLAWSGLGPCDEHRVHEGVRLTVGAPREPAWANGSA